MGFGINVYLRSHTDQDFMMSIVQAHIDERHYTASDSIVCYICFPRIGTAVALRPGDSPVAAKKISGENDGSSWCPFSVSQVIGYENVRWVSHKILLVFWSVQT